MPFVCPSAQHWRSWNRRRSKGSRSSDYGLWFYQGGSGSFRCQNCLPTRYPIVFQVPCALLMPDQRMHPVCPCVCSIYGFQYPANCDWSLSMSRYRDRYILQAGTRFRSLILLVPGWMPQNNCIVQSALSRRGSFLIFCIDYVNNNQLVEIFRKTLSQTYASVRKAGAFCAKH